MGPQLELEMWQPGKVQLNKITKSLTYLTNTNYWAPLLEKIEESEEEHEEMNAVTSKQPQPETKTNKWTQWILKRQERWLVIDWGATSHTLQAWN